MKRFQEKEPSFTRLPVGLLCSMLIFLILFFCFFFSIDKVSEKTSKAELDLLKQAVQRNIVHCYVIEGRYPQSLEYLETQYGLTYDKDKYFVAYEVLGQNIMPDVTIIPRKGD